MALSGLERAEDLTAYLQKQLLELEDSSSEKAKEVKQELKEAKNAGLQGRRAECVSVPG